MKKLLLVIPSSWWPAMPRMTWSGTKKHEKERKATIQECKRKTRMNFRNLIAKTRARPIVSCLCSAKKTANQFTENLGVRRQYGITPVADIFAKVDGAITSMVSANVATIISLM